MTNKKSLSIFTGRDSVLQVNCRGEAQKPEYAEKHCRDDLFSMRKSGFTHVVLARRTAPHGVGRDFSFRAKPD